MDTYFLYNPITINVYNTTNENKFIIDKTIVLLNNVSDDIFNKIINYAPKYDKILENFYGKHWKTKLKMKGVEKIGKNNSSELGFDDIDFNDIINTQFVKELSATSSITLYENKHNKAISQSRKSDNIEYINSVKINGNDTITIFKSKIAYVLNMAIYKLHIRGVLGYVYTINDDVYTIDISNIYNHGFKLLYNIPIDYKLSNNEELINIKSTEDYTLLSSLIELNILSNLDVYTLDSFFKDKKIIEQEVLTEQLQYNMIYQTFVSVYFPLVSPSVFDDYIRHESTIKNKYPDLNVINSRFEQEIKLTSVLKETDKSFIVSLSSIKIILKNYININNWNVFNLIDISKIPNLQYVQLLVNHNNKVTLYTKTTTYFNKKYSIRNLTNVGSIYFNFTILDNHTLSLVIDKNAEYTIFASLDSSVIIELDDIIKHISNLINPIINMLNSNMNIINNNDVERLFMVNKTNIDSINGNFQITWPTKITSSLYRVILDYFDKFADIEYLQKINDTSYALKYGVSMFTNKSKPIKNDFLRYTNVAAKKRWEFLYLTKIIKIIDRQINLVFEISDITLDELSIVKQLIATILNLVSRLDIPEKSLVSDLSSNKLKFIDPILYKFTSESGDVYSRLCQKSNQPVVVSKKQASELKNVMKYKNFTTNTDIFYHCPQKKYPFVKFLPNVHPNNYCVPCCKKKAIEKNTAASTCLSTFKYDTTNAELSKQDDVVNRYAMNYNMTISFPNRLMELPSKSLGTLLNGGLEQSVKERYYILGIDQTKTILYESILNALLRITNMQRNKFIQFIIAFINENKINFNSLLQGDVAMYFINTSELIIVINKIFILNKEHITEFNRWDELFVEILTYSNLQVILLEDINDEIIFKNKYSIENVYEILQLDLEFSVVIKKGNIYNIIVHTNLTEYFSTKINADSQIIFKKDDTIIKSLLHIVDSHTTDHTTNISDIEKFIKDSENGNKYSICKYFINRNDLCYALLLSLGTNNFVYISVTNVYKINIPKSKIQLIYDRHSHNTSINSLITFINEYNNFILEMNATMITKEDKSMYMKNNKHLLDIDNNPIFNEVKIKALHKFIHIDKFIILGKLDDCNITNLPIIGVVINNVKNYFKNELSLKSAIKMLDDNKSKLIADISDKNINQMLTRAFSFNPIENENICNSLKSYNTYFAHIIYEPIDVYDALTNPINNNIKTNIYNTAFYDINVYKILLYKIIKHFKFSKNNKVRNFIFTVVDKLANKSTNIANYDNYTNELFIGVQKILKIDDSQLMKEIYDEIFTKINNLFDSNDKKGSIVFIKNYFNQSILKFDNILIESFKFMKKHEVKDHLLAVIDKLVTITNNKNKMDYTNQLLLCDTTSKNKYQHCDSSKVKINSKTDLNRLLDLIAYDFINPFKQHMITSLQYIDTIIDANIFNHYINQKIYINI